VSHVLRCLGSPPSRVSAGGAWRGIDTGGALALEHRGLSTAEVSDRVARGLVNAVPDAPSRTYGQIIRANVFTRFNFLLGSLLAVILVVGPIQDALFGVVLVSNALVGIVQEVRAKRTLERLALINAPKANVIRDGERHEIEVGEVVLDDLLEIGSGDQVVVDGKLIDAVGLEVDESALTGESDPIGKRAGDEVLSGSFVVAGSATYQATRVGADAQAARLAERARRFTLARSELRAAIDRIIAVVTWVLVPTAALLFATQIATHHQDLRGALRGAVAGSVAMVPEGLVLLTSVTFAVSVIRLGRQQVLVQELPAVETLARVDVLCFDKTGTITAGDLSVSDLVDLPGGRGDVRTALGAIAAADPNPNATLRALAAAYPAPDDWTPTKVVPFSSARKWSAASFDGYGNYVLGAPEVVLAARDGPGGDESPGGDGSPGDRRGGDGRGADGELLRRTEEFAVEGSRVVLLAASPEPIADGELPHGLEPLALAVLGDRIRPDAAPTIGYFRDQGVHTKVVSGDHPRTVAAVARRVGIPDADEPVDARSLPTDTGALAGLLERRSVFGRVVPDQKQAMVEALHSRGHVVAMTGDGVNDVLALKDADLGIAMGNGSPASRAVAQLVLLSSRFATLPSVVAEGRRVIANIERVAKLFVSKTVYATALAVAVGIARLPFPFLPRQLTLVGSLTIGIPGFFLALEPNARRARPDLLHRVMVFAVPAGLVAACATLLAYWLAHRSPSVPLDQARTTATMTLTGSGLWILWALSRPLNRLRVTILLAMLGALVGVLAIPWLREQFALALPPAPALAGVGVLLLVVGVVIELVAKRVD
jgi:cation-transporting P-type ATPase E